MKRNFDQLLQKQTHGQVLRFSASDVAGICGYHPYMNPLIKFTDHLYQDLPHLLQEDTKALGLRIVDREEEVRALMGRLGAAGRGALEGVRRRARDARTATTAQAAGLTAAVRKEVDQAVAKGKLSKDQGVQLFQELRHEVNTEFGRRTESPAIALYERQTGWEVYGRNDAYLRWPFPRARAQAAPPPPPPPAWFAPRPPRPRPGDPDYERAKEIQRALLESLVLVFKLGDDSLQSKTKASRDRKRVQRVLNSIVSEVLCQSSSCGALTVNSECRSRPHCSKKQLSTFIGEDGKLQGLPADGEGQAEDSAAALELVPGEPLLDPGSYRALAELGKLKVAHDAPNKILQLTGRLEAWEWSLLWRISQEMGLGAVREKAKNPHDSCLLFHLADDHTGANNTHKGSPTFASKNNNVPQAVIDLSEDTDDQPFFNIVGFVDGVCDQLVIKDGKRACTADGEGDGGSEQWELRRVVVEVKNRMSAAAARRPPPLYDQIQALVYMQILGCDACDLVQYARARKPGGGRRRTNNGCRGGGRPAPGGTATVGGERSTPEPQGRPASTPPVNAAGRQPRGEEQGAGGEEEKVHVTRVDRDKAPLFHQQKWDQIILERLYSYAEAVYKVRDSEEMRRTWLSSEPGVQYAMLCSLCSHFEDIDRSALNSI